MSCFKIREIILDTETTGLSVKTDRLIELAAIKLEDGRRTPHTYHSYFNPQPVKVSRSAFNVHGISNEFLSDKPAFKNCAREFLEFVAGHELIAHNARFDLQIINRELQMAGADPIDAGCWRDSLSIAKQLFPNRSNSMAALCKRFNLECETETHSAARDCELLARVYELILDEKRRRIAALD